MSRESIQDIAFCSQCDNMYYLRLDDHLKELIYYCRVCGITREQEQHVKRTAAEEEEEEEEEEEQKDSSKSLVLLRTTKKKGKQTTQAMLQCSFMTNPYIPYDPTLPRLYDMECPRQTQHKDAKLMPEIVYTTFECDKSNHVLPYTYFCMECKHNWIL